METFSAEEIQLAHQALNEVLNGPDAIPDWEFHSRMGVDRNEAILVLDKLERMYRNTKEAASQPRSGGIR